MRCVPESTDPLIAIRAAVDVLARLDQSQLCTAEIAELAVGLQQQQQRLDALAAQLLDRWQDGGLWAADGSRSAATHLARELRASVATCRRELRRARATRELPVVAEAIVTGDLSMDHLDLFAATRTDARSAAMDRDQQFLVDHCRGMNYAEARKLLAYWANAHDATLPLADANDHVDSSQVFLSETLDGTWRLDGTLDPLAGGIVSTELQRLERLIRERDAAAGKERTPSQRRAAALLEMAQRSSSHDHARQPARPLFTVLVGQDALKNLCELADGTVIAPGQLMPWLSTADYESILFDGPHTVISVSHRRRFTGALRRAIEVRDRRCTHPSDCDIPASRCDVDHIVPHSQHGPTSQFNGRLQCATHNRNRERHANSPMRPMPHRSITELDHIRGRLRYQYLSESSDDPESETVSR